VSIMNITVENPYALLLLLTVPILAIMMTSWRKGRVILSEKIVNKTIFGKISVRKSDRFGLRRAITLFAITFIILAISNPQLPGAKQLVNKESSDIFIAFDISRSMLSQDIAPDRITKAKLFAVKLVESMRSERIGLIVFAGAAYVYMPLTNDYNAAIDFINGLSTEMASYQGTAIGDAIEVAEKAFTQEANRSKGLIIISDGEDHDSDAEKAAEKASQGGMVITTLGVGTERGGMIPDNSTGGANYKLDDQGNPIRSKLDASALKKIATKAQGSYYNIGDNTESLKGVLDMVSKLDKGEYQSIDTANNFSLYPFFLWPAAILLMIELLMGMGLLITKKQTHEV